MDLQTIKDKILRNCTLGEPEDDCWVVVILNKLWLGDPRVFFPRKDVAQRVFREHYRWRVSVVYGEETKVYINYGGHYYDDNIKHWDDFKRQVDLQILTYKQYKELYGRTISFRED